MTQEVFFGENVRNFREQKGWSRADFLRLLERAGFSMYPTTLKRIEDGVQIPKLTEALAIAGVFGVSVDALSVEGLSSEVLQRKEVSEATNRVTNLRKDALLAWGQWNDACFDLANLLMIERRAEWELERAGIHTPRSAFPSVCNLPEFIYDGIVITEDYDYGDALTCLVEIRDALSAMIDEKLGETTKEGQASNGEG